MKNFYVFLILCFPFFVQSQITLNGDDMPQAGDVQSTVDCHVPIGFSVGSAGANQTYDFSMLTPMDTVQVNFIEPNNTPGNAEFPNATLVGESEDAYVYYQQTSDEFLLLGFLIDTSVNSSGQYLSSLFTPPEKVFEIPTTYNTSFQTTTTNVITLPGEAGTFDSIRTITVFEDEVLFDGYGMINIPNASFEGLREKVITTNNTTVETLVFGIWTTLFTDTSVDTSYNWYAKNNLIVASASIYNGAVEFVSYSIPSQVTLAPMASFSIENIDGGTISFSDASTNSPTSWTWDFGDGNTSTEQNPQHTFTATGDYNVCLTASNSVGSDMVCQTVSVIISAVEDLSNSVAVTLFPNPVGQDLTLHIDLQDAVSLNMEFVNILGQVVQTEVLLAPSVHTINVKNLVPGTYYYYLTDRKGRLKKSGTFLKN